MDYTSADTGGLPIFRDYRTWLYGKSSFDQTHALVFNYVWDIPDLGKRYNNSVLSYIVGYWQVSGVTTFASGFPLGIGLATVDNADITGGGDGARVKWLKRLHSRTVSVPSTAGLTLQCSADRRRAIMEMLPKTLSGAQA